jgi:putative acetyltransferase
MGTEYGEIKRMYVRPQLRGRGFTKLMLNHLADYARSHGLGRLPLETGIHQHAAIALYEQTGFERIPPFGDYKDDPSAGFTKSVFLSVVCQRDIVSEVNDVCS